MELKIQKNELIGEKLYYGVHSSGLKIYIIPKKDYSKNYAIFGTRYGSVDSEFIVPGESEVTKVPDGIAHYLEHKMFDQPDGSNVFDKFSQYGANANAFTSFNMTAYLFSSASYFDENLKTLMDYVQSPYFTKESVQKEQGIIGQEIRMYDDSGDWKVFFNLLSCLYNNNPVKKDIAGTVESISHITDEYLYKCYNTFYNLSNMTIVIAGDVEPYSIANIIDASVKKNEPFSDEIKRIYPSEPEHIAQEYFEQNLSVSSPLYMIGFKDTDIGYSGERLLKKNIEVDILLRLIFGKSSPLYKELYEEGLINSNYSYEYTVQPDYAFSSVGGESKNPKAVYEKILAEIERIRQCGISEDDFNRTKKVLWGHYIRSLNDTEEYAGTFLRYSFMDIDYFNYDRVYKSVTFEDVKNRFNEHFKKGFSAISIVNPI